MSSNHFDLFQIQLPAMEEAAKMNREKKGQLREHLRNLIKKLDRLTTKVSTKKDVSSSSAPLSKRDEAKVLLEAVSEQLKNQLENLGKSCSLNTMQDRSTFNASRSNVKALWKQYQSIFSNIVSMKSGSPGASSSKRR